MPAITTMFVLLLAGGRQIHAGIVFFQEGGNAFSTTDATYLHGGNTTTNYGSDTLLRAQGSTELDTLIRFPDIFGNSTGQVALGSTINSATLTLRVADTSPGTFGVHQVLTNWGENTVTFDNFGGGSGGISGTDFVASPSTTFVPTSTGPLALDVTSIVQSFSSGDANLGFYIAGSGPIWSTSSATMLAHRLIGHS